MMLGENIEYFEEWIRLIEDVIPSIKERNLIFKFVIVEELNLSVNKENETFIIKGPHKPSLFRGIALLASSDYEETFSLTENINFETVGPMFDLSRNAVFNLMGAKKWLISIARMGLNACMLYMEDTYEVPGYPYFGHMRGRYSQSEMKELDDFSNILGIELIPCIQTLGHLANPLKWSSMASMRDTPDILLVGSEETKSFIEAMIASLSECFSSKKIHIGMDEAHNLGLGRYLEQNGYQNRMKLMLDHLNEVVKICSKFDLEPLMWSDMFMRLTSSSQDYYDINAAITQEIIDLLPNVNLMYWDYYHHDHQIYENMFKLHKQMSPKVSFAGGAWTWNGIAPNYGKALETSEKGLKEAKNAKIKEVFATFWGDDGAETPYKASLLMLQYFAEHMYHEHVTLEKLKKQFYKINEENADLYLILDRFDQTPGVAKNNPDTSNASKLILYQDVLNGLYEVETNRCDLITHYIELRDDLATKLQKIENNGVQQDSKQLTIFYFELANTIVTKLKLTRSIQENYHSKNKEAMRNSMEMLSVLKSDIQKLSDAHREIWLNWYKPFGLEIIDLRYGAIIQRLNTYRKRLAAWIDGTVHSLEELEVERLANDYYGKDNNENRIGFGFFKHAYSASKISDV